MSCKIVTGDVFNTRGSALRACQKRAGFFGLQNLCVPTGGAYKLMLLGGKFALMAYYASTMFVANSPTKAIGSIVEVAHVK